MVCLECEDVSIYAQLSGQHVVCPVNPNGSIFHAEQVMYIFLGSGKEENIMGPAELVLNTNS